MTLERNKPMSIEREGGTTTVVNGEFISETRVASTTHHDPKAPDVTYGDPIREARTTFGIPKTGSDITEDHIVNLNGMEGRIKDMLNAGLLVRTQDGSYAVPGTKTPEETPEWAEESPAETMESLGNELEGSITEVAQNASVGDVMSCITSIANTGDINEKAVDRIASQMGLEPEAARDRANTIRAGFESQARATVESGGLDSDDVFNWAWENKPDLMRQAIIQQATQRNTKAYQSIADEYVLGMDKINPDAIMTAQLPEGMTPVQRKDGTILIKTSHGEYSWGALVRSGAISIGKAR